MISAADETPEVSAHLETCRECTRWSEQLTVVRLAAAGSFPETPAGLADRTLAAVRLAQREGRAESPAPRRPRARRGGSGGWWRGVAARAAIAAAAAAAVAVAALNTADRHPAAGEALVAAARATQHAGTARIAFEASLEATLDDAVSIAAPDDVPVARGGTIGAISLGMSGRGEAVLPDRIHVSGTLTGPAPFSSDPSRSTPYELVVIGADAWLRTPAAGASWVHLPPGAGSVRLALEPGALLAMLRGAEGSVSDLGETTLEGELVHRFRASADGATMEAWVGAADGIVRLVVMSREMRSAGAHVRSSVSMRIYDVGADVSVRPPPPDEVISPEDVAARAAFRFGFDGFSISVQVSGKTVPGAAPKPAPPPPALEPGEYPSAYPSGYPTAYPSEYPSGYPTAYPSESPSEYPGTYPTPTRPPAEPSPKDGPSGEPYPSPTGNPYEPSPYPTPSWYSPSPSPEASRAG